jgi:hypothetical protein
MTGNAISPGFLGPARVELLFARAGGKIYRLTDPLDYLSALTKEIHTVPAGFESDGASVPRIFWSVFPPSGPYTPAAILHDALCEERTLPAKTVHRMFLEAMHSLGVPRRIRWPMYAAVRAFGPRWEN